MQSEFYEKNCYFFDVKKIVNLPMKPNDLYLEIGKRITNLRLALGWSQEEAASKLNVTRVTWNHMEKGNQKISIDRLLAVAELFKITPGRLVPGLMPEEPEERVRDEYFSEEETETIYKTLDKYQSKQTENAHLDNKD